MQKIFHKKGKAIPLHVAVVPRRVVFNNRRFERLHETFRTRRKLEIKKSRIPLQAWRGLKALEGGKVVSPTHRLPLHPENIPGTHSC
jgi:hypothetical protein